MNRSDSLKPARVAYVIGTFAGAPATMGSMNAFLSWLKSSDSQADYDAMHAEIDRWYSHISFVLALRVIDVTICSSSSLVGILSTPARRQGQAN